jgi:hypothetical protein
MGKNIIETIKKAENFIRTFAISIINSNTASAIIPFTK